MNTRGRLSTLIICAPLLLAAKRPQPAGAVLSNTPLGSEQTVIYRTFLTSYLSDPANGSDAPLNVVLTTEPFNPGPEIHPDQACLSANSIDNLATPELHHLSADALPTDQIKLIDINTSASNEKSRTASAQVTFLKRRPTATPASTSSATSSLPPTMLTLSEIVFNKQHTLAAFHYTFACGEECGHGETVVYQRQGDVWKLAKTGCSKWVI